MTPPNENRTCPCKQLPWSVSSFTAAEYGEVHSLMNKGTKVWNKRDGAGYTPLHLAAQHNQVAATALLLKLGANVNGEPEDRNGATPLHRAAFSGATSTMQLLLREHTCDLLARDASFGDYKTPLHKAATGGRYLAVQLLLQELRDRNQLQRALEAKDSSARTPLQVAADICPHEQTERDSVARWDVVAGGPADWHKCVAILKVADKTLFERPTSSVSDDEILMERLPAPPNQLTSIDGCLECNQLGSGLCLTSSWQAAFHVALGSAVDHALAKSQQQAPDSTTGVCNNTPSLVNSGDVAIKVIDEHSTADQTFQADTGGAACMICGKPTISLHRMQPDLLACKACRRTVR